MLLASLVSAPTVRLSDTTPLLNWATCHIICSPWAPCILHCLLHCITLHQVSFSGDFAVCHCASPCSLSISEMMMLLEQNCFVKELQRWCLLEDRHAVFKNNLSAIRDMTVTRLLCSCSRGQLGCVTISSSPDGCNAPCVPGSLPQCCVESISSPLPIHCNRSDPKAEMHQASLTTMRLPVHVVKHSSAA